MDIYNTRPENKQSGTKRLERFFRAVFLISSVVFAVMLGLVMIDKTDTISNATNWMAMPLIGVWFGSLALWLIFLLINSKIGKFIFSPAYKADSKKRRVGFVILYIWFLFLIAFVTVIYLGASGKLGSSNLLGILISTIFFGVLFLLTAWGFLLGNKLVKILVAIPAAFFTLAFFIYLFILRPHKIVGNSMSPGFVSGEYVLSEKVTYYSSSPKRGDVVIFTVPGYPNEERIARIVGLPGEYIAIKSGIVYINDKVLPEPYLQPGTKTEEKPFLGVNKTLIPENSYAILGDRRSNSNDSRNYGFVPKSEIKSRVFYVYWPTERSGLVNY